MNTENMAILKSLVSVVWADGKFASEEAEMLRALLAAFEATTEEADHVLAYAKTPRALEDIPLSDLSTDDRRMLLNHAVLMSHVDGELHADETAFLNALATTLRIPSGEASDIIARASARAERLKPLLS